MERYLTLCNAAKVKPIIALNKIDLISPGELSGIVAQVYERITQVPVVTISCENQGGINELKNQTEKGKTYCLLGSSGVGKSTLVNQLPGKQMIETSAISNTTHKGRHATTHRELIILENGSSLIDNPGMREVGIADLGSGVEKTFDLLLQYSKLQI